MLLSNLSTAYAVTCLFFLIFCVFFYVWASRLADYCRTAVDFVVNQNKNALGLRRLTDLETSLTELTDSYDSLITSHKKLRSRIGMRKLREQDHEPSAERTPDPIKDPAGYKRVMRLRLRESGALKG